MVRIMNSASLNNKNIMNNIGIFNDSVTMTSNLRGKYWDEQFHVNITHMNNDSCK
jgi:hypothetical protein